MKFSLTNTRHVNSQYGCSDNTELADTDTMVTKIGAQLGAVEAVAETGSLYDGIVVAWVVSCVDHPNADRLHVCKIDDGGVVKDVARDDQGHVEVVCGAPNVHADMLVAWLPPGVTVPSSVGKEPFVLEARELRGVVSNGMLASAKELAIGDSHEGILEIKAVEVGPEAARPGVPFKQLYGLDDVVIDIENKMFTHRPDCFGQLGVAREIAGIFHKPFRSPEWYLKPTAPQANRSEAIKAFGVTNHVPELVPRYMLAAVENVTVGPSPIWLQAYLSRVGVRPINNIVDMTNYMMLLTGQPLHAFDFDKVARDGNAQIVVRKPKAGEKLTLLDGKTIEPRPDAILICDLDKPIGLGGMMGGNNSEIDEHTTRILIECASFDMYNIRKSSMEHGIFTDAVTRFTKGQSPWQCPTVLYKAVQMVGELSPGAVPVGEPVDSFADVKPATPVEVSATFINERLGINLSPDEMAGLLINVEFSVNVTRDVLTVEAPFWRTDIEIREDVVEEVGRLYGFDRLPLELPCRDLTPARRDSLLSLNSEIRQVLARAGANELLTYSFVHGNLLAKVGQDRDLAFQLGNALSPDLQYYRLSLTPSLLDKVHPNSKAGYEEFALFELGKSHIKGEMDSCEPALPKEFNALSLVIAANGKAAQKRNGSAYYQAKLYLDYLLSHFGVRDKVQLVPLSEAKLSDKPRLNQLVAPYAPARSAVLQTSDGIIWGIVGEFKSTVRQALKLPVYSAGFELGPFLFLKTARQTTYQPLPRFPKVEQDITIKVPSGIAYAGLYELLTDELEAAKPPQSLATLTPLSIYQKDGETKNVSFRLEIASYERTLTTDEVNGLLDKVAAEAHTVVGAQRI